MHLEAVIVGVRNNDAPIAQAQDSQRMLQEGIGARAVLVAKAEEVLGKEGVPTDACLHRPSCLLCGPRTSNSQTWHPCKSVPRVRLMVMTARKESGHP